MRKFLYPILFMMISFCCFEILSAEESQSSLHSYYWNLLLEERQKQDTPLQPNFDPCERLKILPGCDSSMERIAESEEQDKASFIELYM